MAAGHAPNIAPSGTRGSPFDGGGAPTSRGTQSKQEVDRHLTTTEDEARRQVQAKQAEAAQKTQNAGLVAYFAKRSREAALVTGATPKAAETATTLEVANAARAFSDTIAMQEYKT